MSDGWTITIQKTGEREELSIPREALDGTQDGNKPIATGVVIITDPQGNQHQFDFQSGGYGNGPMPGLDNPNGTITYDLDWSDAAFNWTDASKQNIGAPYEDTNGNDSWLRIKDSPLMGGRNSFGFHPDGGYRANWRQKPNLPPIGPYNDGTAGCIGIKASQATQFFDILSKIPNAQRPSHITILQSAHGPDLQMRGRTMPLTEKEKTYQIQAFLQLQGYNPNGIDGALGNGLAKAFQRYAVDKQLPLALKARADQLVTETDKTPDKRDQELINKIRNEIYEYVVSASQNPEMRRTLATAAINSVTTGGFDKSKAKAARAAALLLKPDANINIEADVGQQIEGATLDHLQFVLNETPVNTLREDFNNDQFNGDANEFRTLNDGNAPQPQGRDWYSDFGKRVGETARQYDNGYSNVVGETDDNPTFAEYTIDVINKAVLDERQSHQTAGLTTKFNDRSFIRENSISNKKLISIFDNATAFRRIDQRTRSSLVNTKANNNIEVKVGDVLFLNRPGTGSKEERRKKNPVIVWKIDHPSAGAMDALRALDKGAAEQIERQLEGQGKIDPVSLDVAALEHLEFMSTQLQQQYNAAVGANNQPLVTAVRQQRTALNNALENVQPYVHMINNGENYKIPHHYFTEGNVEALREIGVHGIGDTQELVKKYNAFEEGTMMTDPTRNNERLNTDLLRDNDVTDPKTRQTNTPNSGLRVIQPVPITPNNGQ